jgi:tetratricopeptide (TPR) repeat protein
MAKSIEAQAESIIGDVLSLPDDARDKAAEAACGTDAELLRRVRSLLSAATMAEGFMSDATAEQPPLNAVAMSEKPGTIIGRYKLLQQIGEGGFGVVFMAEQEKPVRRTVALKVIKLGMDTREVVARFEAERQALAMMDHPNIAKVLDAGATDTGRPYFVMELVRGSSITDYCDKHRMPTAGRVALIAQVCRAVQHAHSKGIIHRDLKPSNVLVTVADDKPIPKVIDFGIAKATQARLTDRTLFTAFRQMLGTPQYMSPEQADSDGSDVDTRTDVYSLGVLLYELLVGTTPFDARALRSAAYDAMRRIIRETEPARPSTKLNGLGETAAMVATARSTDVKRLGQTVRGELDWIVMKSLEKDRSRRYETAAAFADDLNRYLSGDAVLAGPASGSYRLKKFVHRYRGGLIIATAAMLLIAAGLAGTTWGLLREARQRRVAEDAQKIAVAQREAAEAQRQNAQAVIAFLTDDLLAKANPELARDHKLSDTLVKALIEPALATIDKRFQGRPAVRAAIQSTLGATLITLGRNDLAEQQCKAAWDYNKTARGNDAPETLDALLNYAMAMDRSGRHADAEPLLKQCWEDNRRVRGENEARTLDVLNDYATCLEELNRHTEAEPLMRQALDRLQKSLGDNDPKTLAALENLGYVMLGMGRLHDAEIMFKKSWEGFARAEGADHPKTVQTLANYAVALGEQNRYEEALPLVKQAWESDQRVLGDEHPETLRALNTYGAALTHCKHVAEALLMLQQGLETSRKTLGADNPLTLAFMANVGGRLYEMNRYSDAEPLLSECWQRTRRVLGETHSFTLAALFNYGQTLECLGRFSEADPLLKLNWELRRKATGDDNSDTNNDLLWYGMSVLQEGHQAEAERLLKQSWETDLRTHTEEQGGSIAALIDYAIAIDAEGRHKEAEPLFKRAWDSSRRVVGEDDETTLGAKTGYGIALDEQGHPPDAETILKQCWETGRRTLGETNSTTAAAESAYGAAVDAQARHTDAEPLLRQATATLRTYPGNYDLGAALHSLGRCLLALEKWSEAEKVLRESLAWDKTHTDPERPAVVPPSLPMLQQCLQAQGKPPEPMAASTAPATQPLP